MEQAIAQASGVRWNLGDIMPAPSGKLFQSVILDQLEGRLVEFELARTELDGSISNERFLELLDNYEKISRLRSKIGAYAQLRFSEDTGSQEARTLKARADEIEADITNRTLFFELWWKRLDEKKTAELAPAAEKYAYFLSRLIQTKPYTLSEPVEQALNMKDVTGRNALLQLYHQIRDSFTYEVEISGEMRSLNEEHVRDLFHSSKREERIAAYSSKLDKFGKNRDVLGEIYQNIVRDWRNEGIKLRHYSSPISVRNIANDVPDEAVETLLSVCKKNAMLFQRFFKLKAKLLSIVDYSRYDLFAPLPESRKKIFTWDEGRKLVLETFENFDSSFAKMAENVFTSSHFDAEVRPRKLGGAYCASVTPEITPYILLNYTGTENTVSTLAHELGHAIHSQLAARSGNNQLAYHAPLPLAETASVFGEMLMFDRLLSEASKGERRSLLAQMVDDSYSTIQRQANFVLFEQEAHEVIASGSSVDELCQIYMNNLKAQFSDSLSIPEHFMFEWISVPHIFDSPFYCYSYAWGNLLVMALYKQYSAEGARSFAPRYLKLLSYGGSESPEKMLNEAGFEIRSQEFWQSGFDEIERFVKELETIL